MMARAPPADIQTGTHVLGACTHRLVKGFCIEKHNEALATVGKLKAIMEGAKFKRGCLAVLMADAGWRGNVTAYV